MNRTTINRGFSSRQQVGSASRAIPFLLHHHRLPQRLHRHCSWQKQHLHTRVGPFDLDREGGHLSQGDHLKPPALNFSSFPLLIVSDTGLTKFLISGLTVVCCCVLPWWESNRVCSSYPSSCPQIVTEKSLHSGVFLCSFTGYAFSSQSLVVFHRSIAKSTPIIIFPLIYTHSKASK